MNIPKQKREKKQDRIVSASSSSNKNVLWHSNHITSNQIKSFRQQEQNELKKSEKNSIREKRNSKSWKMYFSGLLLFVPNNTSTDWRVKYLFSELTAKNFDVFCFVLPFIHSFVSHPPLFCLRLYSSMQTMKLHIFFLVRLAVLPLPFPFRSTFVRCCCVPMCTILDEPIMMGNYVKIK